MAEFTILKMGTNLVVPVQVELHDRAALGLQEAILRRIEETGATGLIIDISAVMVVDSFLARLLGDTARMARIMGAETVLVGMRREVVITLVQLGMALHGIHTALNMEYGMELLEQMKRETGALSGEGPP